MNLIFPTTILLFPLLTSATKNYHGCTWDRPNFRKCKTENSLDFRAVFDSIWICKRGEWYHEEWCRPWETCQGRMYPPKCVPRDPFAEGEGKQKVGNIEDKAAEEQNGTVGEVV
ncbi:hypothetical protein IQ06DRAFT_351697 [Phaeosphaeriaceae sp. SRC1lsM3a]|nr:hypothetical protein IQ06DRAFT_351697 [Stagonospora sp. SRC1lsM3a]